MSLNHLQFNRYVISEKGMAVVPAELLAKIEAHNLKDRQAMARARAERIKWLLAKQQEKSKLNPKPHLKVPKSPPVHPENGG